MNLPPGKTCGDCANFARCQGFFGCPATNDNCDWSPSKFKQKVAIATVTASNSHAVLIDENQRLRAEVKKLTEEARQVLLSARPARPVRRGEGGIDMDRIVELEAQLAAAERERQAVISENHILHEINTQIQRDLTAARKALRQLRDVVVKHRNCQCTPGECVRTIMREGPIHIVELQTPAPRAEGQPAREASHAK
jgi:regulator of replication initiation timing